MKVLPITTMLEIMVEIPKISIKRYRRAMLSMEMKMLVQV